MVRTGGQYCTQLALLQLDAVALSARKRYRVSPLESTRTCPNFVLPTLILVPIGAGDGLGATIGATLGPELGDGYAGP